MFIAAAVCLLLVMLLIGVLLLWILGVVNLVMIVIAVFNANSGIHFEYPFSLRLIK